MANLSVEQITEEALSLPDEARAHLAERLAESLIASEDNIHRQLWTAGAIRRRDELREGRVQGISSEDAFARVREAVIAAAAR